jgi:hypothetical protein
MDIGSTNAEWDQAPESKWDGTCAPDGAARIAAAQRAGAPGASRENPPDRLKLLNARLDRARAKLAALVEERSRAPLGRIPGQNTGFP